MRRSADAGRAGAHTVTESSSTRGDVYFTFAIAVRASLDLILINLHLEDMVDKRRNERQ